MVAVCATSCASDDPAAVGQDRSSPATVTTAPTTSVDLSEDTSTCGAFGVSRPPAPETDDEMAMWFAVVNDYLETVDPLIPSSLSTDWADATEGVRLLLAEIERSGLDVTAVDFNATEFAPDPGARAAVTAWCEARGIEVGSGAPFETETVVDETNPTVGPPEACASGFEPLYLGNDDIADWITTERGEEPELDAATTSYVVCNSQSDTTSVFDGPRYYEALLGVDVERDGVDDLILVGGTTAFSLTAGVWSHDIRDGMQPMLDADGQQLLVENSSWWEAKTTETGWYGCGDFDGDGRLGFATGTYDIVDGRVEWEGRELVMEDGSVVASIPIAGAVVHDSEALWPQTQSCLSAHEVREKASLPCASLEQWPGGEPYHGGFSGLTEVAPVQPGDVLVSLLPAIEVWRNGESLGAVALGDRHLSPAHHDHNGGLVVDEPGLYSILHLPYGRESLPLVVPAGPDEQLRLMGVEEVDGVPTALVLRRRGDGRDVTGDLLLQPLDGSPSRALSAPEYSEGGTSTVDWDGTNLVLTGGGEGSAWLMAMDLDGTEVELPWNLWREGWGDSEGLHLAVAVDGSTAWVAFTEGLFTVLHERDAGTGELRNSYTIAGPTTEIDIAGDRILLQHSGLECIRLYDPQVGMIEELRHGGTATVG